LHGSSKAGFHNGHRDGDQSDEDGYKDQAAASAS